MQNQPGDDREMIGAAGLAYLGCERSQAGRVPNVVEALGRKGQNAGRKKTGNQSTIPCRVIENCKTVTFLIIAGRFNML
jgi:hypothetical protein